MWQAVQYAVQYAGTPLAVVALVVAVVARAYLKGIEAKYKTLDGVNDPKTRLDMLVAILGQYRPEVDNLRIEDKVQALDRDARHRMTKFKLTMIIGAICFALLLVAVVSVSIFAPRAQGATSLPAHEGKAAASNDPAQPMAPSPVDPDRFAKLEDYKGSVWQPKRIKFLSAYRRVERTGDPPLPPPAADDPPEPGLFTGVSFDLVNLSDRDDVVVQSIRVKYRPVPGHWVPAAGVITHPNVRHPLLFQARLKAGAATADAELIDDDEKPVRDHLIKLTKAEPRAKIVIGFTGDLGPHRVHVEVVVREDRGDRRLVLDTTQTTRCVWVVPVEPES